MILLQIILNKTDLRVVWVHTEYSMKNLQGRSVRLDVFAEDSSGIKYNVEVQRSNQGAGARRARYNSSLMDMNITTPGEEYSELAETYVIFITEKDVLCGNEPIYHVERMIVENQEYFNDGAHIVYVNAARQDRSPLGLLMHDFSCMNADDMYYPILADRVRYFKEERNGVESMSGVFDEFREVVRKQAEAEFREKGRMEGREEGREEGCIASARRMLEDGKISCEDIAKYCMLTIEQVKELAKGQMA